MVLPVECKCANITPLYKKGCRADVSNYRPVSLTSVVCKLMESILRANIMEHFTANKFFSSKQFGFIKQRSMTLQLLQILDIWTECLEQGGQIELHTVYPMLYKPTLKTAKIKCYKL